MCCLVCQMEFYTAVQEEPGCRAWTAELAQPELPLRSVLGDGT